MPTKTENPRRDGYAENVWFICIIAFMAAVSIWYLVHSAQTSPDLTIPQPSAHVKLTSNLGAGSGVHIGDGYIITAAHVVVDPFSPGKLLETTVTADDGSKQPATILWKNSEYDIALIRVGNHNIDAVFLDCSPVEIGDKVSAYGNPIDMDFIYTTGEVVGDERKFGFWDSAVPLSLSVGPGQSGGGVINTAGDIVGITVGTLVSPYGAIGVGMMVPASTVCMLMGRK